MKKARSIRTDLRRRLALRLALAMLLMWPAMAQAQMDAATPQPTATDQETAFAQTLAADVFSSAFTFMAPRTLEAVPAPTLALWGLRGLTAIDPSLSTSMDEHNVILTQSSRLVTGIERPPFTDYAAWGKLIARMAASAWTVSPQLRHAQTQGIINSVFDEVFNHLDPYSRYEPPRDDDTSVTAQAGIGVTLARRGHGFIIRTVATGTAAEAIGLQPGQSIIALNGHPLEAETVSAAEAQLQGPEGSTVRLTVSGGPSHQLARDIQLRRAEPQQNTVTASQSGNLLVLHITSFSHSTGQDIANALSQFLRQRKSRRTLRGIVLDLRGNRGGLVKEAAAATSAFLGDDSLIATMSGRDPQANRIWQATGDDLTGTLPVIIIVDGRSASASEILAAALADDRRGVVIGSTTLGKGLVQTVSPLPDGGTLFITWSRVLAPLGWPIQGLGVMPQVCTSTGHVALDAQLMALQNGQLPMMAALTRNRMARAPMPAAEMMDIRNSCPAAEGGDSDMEAAHFLMDHPAAYAAALIPATLGLNLPR
ncbi:S41 family peptidase [Granulibacter bethesdensis]|uniref:S41 family peptidase n=1 Tax=Granulibacter bethesdensis TaxID=364410 RepID=UPI00046D4A9A|nr:S41 family peptidase [Granulibacter bethesdensis]AHJ69481.2 Carboxy-terminal processing protease precursor [Granulibacter bethesdensis]